MADKKISALPAATTPLAGTEVLPIVQSGTTDQVSVANLTAGRAVSALSVTTTQDVTTGRNLIVTGAGRVEQNGAAGGLYFINTAVSAGATNMRFYTTNASGVAQLQYQLNGGTTPTNQVYGDLIAETGNFKPGTAGKGIDFSANTHGAGMTSELLNYYEEGNWTPSQGGQLVVVGAFSSEGRYTRIGRTIHFTGYVAGATSVALTAVGQLTSNLPYNTGNTFLGVGAATNANSSAGSILSISITSLYNVTTISATPKIYFSGTYTI